MQALVDAIGPNGKLEIGTTGMALILSTVELGAVAGTVSGTTMTLSGVPLTDVSIDATGVAATARIRTALDVDVITNLDVGLNAQADPGGVAYGHVQLDKLDFVLGEQFSIDVGTFTHA